MSTVTPDDDIIEVKLSKGSIAALAKVMGGGGGQAQGGKGGALAGLLKLGTKGTLLLGGIGVAIGGILSVVKGLAGSSPMLKQMMKLMNFGIMMIFRPIGDFIGFLLRPIIVLLLRNFIIPWYKDAMPVMIALGTFFGGTIAEGMKTFFANPSTAIADGLTGLSDWATDNLNSMLDGTFDWADLSEKLRTGLLLIFADFNPGYHLAKTVSDVIAKMDWSRLGAKWDEVGQKIRKAVGDWFWNGLNSITASWYQLFSWVGDWFWNGLNSITANWYQLFTWVGNWFWNGLNGIKTSWGDIWYWIKDWIWNGLQAASNGLGNIIGYADGGQINEPILGFGKSGQMYSFGERGSETVIPHGESPNGGGITLNISVGNISSEADMRNFETRVMDILENANSRRGRL